jgi:hypothetical protein
LDKNKWIKGSNMKLKLAVLAFCLLLIGSTAFSSTTYYIPQVAIGTYTGMDQQVYGFHTTFVLFNNTEIATSVSMVLTDNGGNPMGVNIPALGRKSSTFSFNLGPGTTNIFQTDNAGSLQSGAATITSDSDIGVSAIYTINEASTGKFVTEVGVQAASLMRNFAIPVQVTGDGFINTGLALYNPSSSAATITLTLKDEDGTTTANVELSGDEALGAGKHTAFYIGGDKFKDIKNFKGMLTVHSSEQISAVTLRQNAPSTVTYTSIPVVSTGQTTFNLAHLADGVVGGTPYQTTFMLFNFGTASANVTIAPRDDSGTALPLTMTDGSTTATSYTIAAGASKFLQTNGSANKWGAAIITSTAPIGAASLFTEYNNDQSFGSEAGVQDSPASTSFAMPIDSKVSLDGAVNTFDTAIAFFNPGTSSVTFSPSFLDVSGVITTADSITLAAKSHAAFYFSGLFPNMGDIQGSIHISGLANGVSAMTLRLNASPFSMTTLPVVSGAATGITPATSGVATRKKLGGVIAAADTTVDAKMPYGYTVTITPTITGATVWSQYGGLGVRALSAGNTYTTTSSGSNYTTNLPPGNYQFSVESYVGGQSTAFFSFYTTNMVQITSNATIPVPVTFPALHMVTGSVTGTSTTAGMFVLSDITGSGSYGYGIAGGSAYSIPAPAGTYQIVYAVNWQGLGPYIANLGTVTVEDADITGPDIVIPTSVNLAGTVNFPDTPPTSTTIRAKNRDGINAQAYAFDTRTVTATSAGTYQNLPVTPGDSYDMSLAYSIGTMTTAQGIDCGATTGTGGFLADAYYTGGATMTTAATIDTSKLTIPAPAGVFSSYRYWSGTDTSGTMYTIPNLTPGQTYSITLYFSDAYSSGAGARVFGITLNGQTVESSFDIIAAAGKGVAIDKTYSVEANSSGQIIIGYIRITSSPKIEAFSLQGGLSTAVTQGTVSYTPPLNNPISVDSDTTYDFTTPVPAALSMVTISGKVTDPSGAAVSGATVSATSSQLNGATTGASFTSTNATTDTSGNYSIKVVPGGDYTLTFAK